MENGNQYLKDQSYAEL